MSVVIEVKVSAADWTRGNLQALWRAIGALGKGGRAFTTEDVCARLETRRFAIVGSQLDELVSGGHLKKAAARGGTSLAARYSIVKAPGRVADSETVRGQQQMWNILRGPQARAGISPADLAILASTDFVPIGEDAAEAYCEGLAAAGYVHSDDQGRYRLFPRKNTGALAPRLVVARFVVDPNTVSCQRRVVAEEVLT